MCLLVIAWRAHARYRLIVAANRDEFHDRPAAPLARWPQAPGILAGRDLRGGGTWLGIDRERRVAAVTNFREPLRPAPGAPTRGGLITAYLGQATAPGEFLKALAPTAVAYSGFNLLLADAHQLWYASNRTAGFAHRLDPGVYGLSNAFLDSPWPKLERVRRNFAARIETGGPLSAGELLVMLNDRAAVDDGDPESRALSAPFVVQPRYGTRSSSVLLIDQTGKLEMVERRFDPAGEANGETALALNAGEWP